MSESYHCSRQSMTPTRSRSIHVAMNKIAAWARQVATKAMNMAAGRDRLFEFSFFAGIDQTWLLDCGDVSRWFRVSFIDGGGRPVKYEDGVFKKFDDAVSDATQNDADPTLLFIATDGSRIFKAFAGPQSAVGEDSSTFSMGFEEGVYIGIWSHEWLRNLVDDLGMEADPDSGWGEMMERMVLSLSSYADDNPWMESTPRG